MDRGQFAGIFMVEGTHLALAAIIHPDGVGAAARLALPATESHLLVAHRLMCVVAGLELQDSQRVLATKLLDDLGTSLKDYDDVIEVQDDEPPF